MADNPRYVNHAADQVADKLVDALVEWYGTDRTACAKWCDRVGDVRGTLLGHLRGITMEGYRDEAPELVKQRILEMVL